MLKQLYILILLTLMGTMAFGQQEKVREAVKAMQQDNIELAKILIDEAVVDEATAGEATTWYYRGFIYKNFYNQKEKDQQQSPARLQAIEAYTKYLELDPTKEYAESNNKGLRYLATTLYNDAATNLNPQNYAVALSNYELYKQTMRVVEPDADFTAKDIQLNLVLGSVYTQIYDSDREGKKDFFNQIRDVYLSVLDLEPDNLSANYNLGILYYNEAVNIIKSLDYDTDIITLELIQDECVELFKKSLPYMQKAYELNPKRKETLIGLAGIYFSLNEMEKSEELQNELKQLEESE